MEIIFGGVVVSLIVQVIKKCFGTNRLVTITTCVVLSLIGGAVYTLLNHLGLWEQAVGMFITAGAFYAFIVKSLEAK
jgi:hypothetical protein